MQQAVLRTEETLPTLRTLWGEGVALLKAANIDSALIDARLLLQHALCLSPESFISSLETEVEDEYTARYFRYLDRRAGHEPTSRIIGMRAFWKQEFLITSATLDPRADSETLIEAALELLPDNTVPLNVLDLGTGTGCLLLSLLGEYPNATGLGVDISTPAAEIASYNAKRLGLGERAAFFIGDWVELADGAYDLVVSNPPYIPSATIQDLMPEVAGYDPRAALDGGQDGLVAYRSLMQHLSRLLVPGGIAILELGIGQEEDVKKLAEEAGYQWLFTRTDLAGIPRALVLQHKL